MNFKKELRLAVEELEEEKEQTLQEEPDLHRELVKERAMREQLGSELKVYMRMHHAKHNAQVEMEKAITRLTMQMEEQQQQIGRLTRDLENERSNKR